MNEGQFWLNWWVLLCSAIATFLAVLAALFGNWFRSWLFPAKLSLGINNAIGQRTKQAIMWETEKGPQQRSEDARYYHLRVTNLSHWPIATNLQVFLVQIEDRGPNDEFQVSWTGEVPIQWMFQAINPIARTLGRGDAFCDLCSVVKEKWLQLHPLIIPNSMEAVRRSPTKMRVTLLARCNEGQSPYAKFEISWDGKWEDGDVEMTRHLTIVDVSTNVS